MDIKDIFLNAEPSDWLVSDVSKSEFKSTVQLAKISAKLEMKRTDMGMTQKEFADFMGVSQAMISKWESREYNFTITTLNEICEKLGLVFDPIIKEPEEVKFEMIPSRVKSRRAIQDIKKLISNNANPENRGIA